MRKPKQVLVLLYRKNKDNKYEYCIFLRRKKQLWQAISGGQSVMLLIKKKEH